MPFQLDPDTLKLFPGQFIAELAVGPERIVRGIVRPNGDAMNRDIAIVKVLRLGPLPSFAGPATGQEARALAELPAARLPDWKVSSGPWASFPFEVGDHLLMPRDFPAVIDWTGRRFLLSEVTDTIAVLEGSIEEILESFEHPGYDLGGLG
jgi:hypothetical protein